MNKRIKILIALLIFILFGIIIYMYAMFFGTRGFVVKEHKIETNKIDEGYNGLKIVHLSDIHYGKQSTSKEDLEEIVEDINLLKPDIVVLTGDLIDNNITNSQYEELVNILNNINASIGKFAIDGNHDYVYKKWSVLIEDCGFINLNDTYELIYKNSYKPILLAGVSNNTYTTKNIKDKTETIFNYINSEKNNSSYNILLMHEPDYIDDIDYSKFDLVLAGHSHNGQVRIPFIGATILPDGAKKYYKEYYKLEDTKLYISSGIGTTILPIRLFNKPSYNFYRIIKK